MYLLYHTLEQVLIGGALGLICGLLWRALTVQYLAPSLFPWLEDTALAQALFIHDGSAVDNVFRAAAETARAAKKRKKKSL